MPLLDFATCNFVRRTQTFVPGTQRRTYSFNSNSSRQHLLRCGCGTFRILHIFSYLRSHKVRLRHRSEISARHRRSGNNCHDRIDKMSPRSSELRSTSAPVLVVFSSPSRGGPARAEPQDGRNANDPGLIFTGEAVKRPGGAAATETPGDEIILSRGTITGRTVVSSRYSDAPGTLFPDCSGDKAARCGRQAFWRRAF